MTHDHGVHKIRKALEAIHGIQIAQVSMDPPQVVVTMHHHITIEVLNAAISAAGNYFLVSEVAGLTAINDHLAELIEHGHEAAHWQRVLFRVL